MNTKTLYSYFLMLMLALGASVAQAADKYLPFTMASESRSAERRVCKECRDRWTPAN